jgi:hypothetical protein
MVGLLQDEQLITLYFRIFDGRDGRADDSGNQHGQIT